MSAFGTALRSFSRLLIGSAAYGYDSLTGRMSNWEETANEVSSLPEVEEAEAPLSSLTPEEREARLKIERVRVALPAEDDETESDHLRYALIGMSVGVQEGLERGIHLADRATRVAGNLAAPIAGPIYNSRLLSPLRRNFENLVERGQAQIENWVDSGRTEEAYDRTLVKTIWYDRVDSSVDYLAADNNVQELVQSQGVGLADKVVEEARERGVSSDNYLEAVVRAMLRRPPHEELPRPEEQVSQVVMPVRRVGGKLLQKKP
jgi:hypothetical protein